jgi:MFS family permease
MISSFYTRKETATRMSVFYTGNLLASSFSGLIAAGIFAGLDGKHGLEGWRWLFLIQGVFTGTLRLIPLHITNANSASSSHRGDSLFPLTQRTPPNPLALSSSATTSTQPHRTRHYPEARQGKRLERSPRGSSRLPHLDLCTHAKPPLVSEVSCAYTECMWDIH